MDLYLVRHGEAAPAPPGRPDAERRLTPRGEAEVMGVALGLRVLGVELDALYTSPLLRARQTAELLARGLPGPAPAPCAALDGRTPAEGLLAALAEAGGRVALVGHQPVLGELVVLAIAGIASGGAPLGTASVACLAFAGRPRPGAGRLRWLLTAAQLGALGARLRGSG